MSDIPRARRILQYILNIDVLETDPVGSRHRIRRALALMTRKSPEFRVEHDVEPMNDRKRKRARIMRRNGLSLRAIALALNTNIGRVSEAVNGKRDGI